MRQATTNCDSCGEPIVGNLAGGVVTFSAGWFTQSDRRAYDLCSKCMRILRTPLEDSAEEYHRAAKEGE